MATLTHSLTHSYSPTLTHSHSLIHTHTHSYTLTHSYSLILTHTHSLIHTHLFTLTHSHSLTHSYSLSLTHSHSPTHTHSHSLTLTHTHSLTHPLILTHWLHYLFNCCFLVYEIKIMVRLFHVCVCILSDIETEYRTERWQGENRNLHPDSCATCGTFVFRWISLSHMVNEL